MLTRDEYPRLVQIIKTAPQQKEGGRAAGGGGGGRQFYTVQKGPKKAPSPGPNQATSKKGVNLDSCSKWCPGGYCEFSQALFGQFPPPDPKPIYVVLRMFSSSALT